VISAVQRLQKELLSLAYFAMRLGIFCFLGLLLSADLALGADAKAGSPSPSPTPELPEVRPAFDRNRSKFA